MKQHALPTLLAAILILTTGVLHVFAAPDHPPYFRVNSIETALGAEVDKMVIAGPPHPPAGIERTPVAQGEAGELLGSKQLTVPAYDWSFGCSATSAAMIAAYYDRSGLPNMYTGPTGGGLMPLDSSTWGPWTDGNGDTYGQCPLTASRSGLDGRSSRGSLNDYWIAYGSTANDPYVTNGWTQHTPSDAIGDYMKTSQSAYGNSDGATSFYAWTSSSAALTCADMLSNNITEDGSYGRKLFYEARGYTVTDCYNQKTDNNGGGFTYAKYKAEIDAGRPVMINLAGHSIVGIGYNDSGNTVYLHDTWDYNTYSMAWGGSYEGMAMQAVSIVNPICGTPANVSSLSIARLDATQVKLTWPAAVGANHYELWSAANQPYFTPGASCSSPGALRCTSVAGTSYTDAVLGSATNNYTYVVRAVSACGSTSLSTTGRAGEFEYTLQRGQ